MVKDAEVEPQDWNVQGRGDLASYHNGFIPTNDNDTQTNGNRQDTISRTLEYAYNDFCILQMAADLGSAADQTKYRQRAGYWKNLFDAQETSKLPNGVDTGFTGFMQPKNPDGTWGNQDPTICAPINDPGGCEWVLQTYEAPIWVYTFFVPQDMAGLASVAGGRATLASRLDYLHTQDLVDIGNEQAFLTCFQFHYFQRPGLATKTVHAYIPSQFNTTLVGIPGNDDSGAMGSFAVWSMMGIFPVAGQDVYLISVPFFPTVNITSPQTGKTAVITTINFDPEYQNIYIQNATYNGQPYSKNWLQHSFFTSGDILELTLGPSESSWGTGLADLPPSMSDS